MSDSQIWRKASLKLDATIKDAIQNLDAVAIKIVLVVNEDGQLEGTVSDGDIRRGLLRGLTMDSSISSIVHRDAFVVPPELGRETVLQLMNLNKVQQIPIVDKAQRVVGIHLWDEITAPAERSNLMVIMAGGRGTRLMPHTENCPKPMVEIAGKPMMEHIIERAKSEGFRNFLVSIHHLGNMIEDYFGDGAAWGVNIAYLREDQPLGTAGALSLIDPLPTEPFIVTNGDVISDIRYGEVLEFHVKHQAAGTMAVRLYEWQHPFGVVHTDGINIIGFAEKPVTRNHINAGVYAFNPAVIESLVLGEQCDMPTLFERLQSQAIRTVAYPMHEPWLDVGRPADLASANNSIKRH
ncbi:nucleotidyltransferase family protein [Rhizobium leguminosarum]|uniref:nucleotidyltransferase family protein n=1 Tax=Rhizobium leguminosarum TaxID=384 RepID=UPI001030CD73|nr:nucleotidyltransferase family protein [Rhizobium leguminosarum]TAU87495.1 CBS domain-containing protein [Rhizobium leguminosarum]TAV52027.1 CBS domain-containing protein [Rhizobium leguminosarum]